MAVIRICRPGSDHYAWPRCADVHYQQHQLRFTHDHVPGTGQYHFSDRHHELLCHRPGAILATSALVFTVIKYLGVAYLLYLGISSLRSKSTDFVLPTETDMRGTRLRLYVKGMLVGASNPKALLFFTAFFPQFINPAAAKLPQFLVLGSTFVFFEFSVLMLYAVFAARLGPWLRSRGKARMFNQVSGGIFVGAAALLATVKRAHTD